MQVSPTLKQRPPCVHSAAQQRTSRYPCKQGTVDYVFYGPGPLPEQSCGNQESDESLGDAMGEASRRGGDKWSCLRCVGVAEPPMQRDLDHFGGLPSPEEPSDHVLLAVRFEVTPP